MSKPLVLWTSRPVTEVRPGTRIYAERVGTVRTVKSVSRVPGKQAVKVVFASKDRAVFALDARVPVVSQ